MSSPSAADLCFCLEAGASVSRPETPAWDEKHSHQPRHTPRALARPSKRDDEPPPESLGRLTQEHQNLAGPRSRTGPWRFADSTEVDRLTADDVKSAETVIGRSHLVPTSGTHGTNTTYKHLPRYDKPPR